MYGKRGEAQSTAEVWLLIAAFLIAAFAGFDILSDTAKRLDTEFLERNYIARDLALAVDALLASPGEITYTYNLGTYNFYVDFDNDKISVKDGFTDTKPATYGITGIAEKSSEFASVRNPDGFKVFIPSQSTVRLPEKCLKPKKLVISKVFTGKQAEMLVTGKNILVCRQADEACRNAVVGCE